MSTDLVPLGTPTASELETIKETVRLISGTEFVPASLRGKPHAVLACILYGRERGLGPMDSLAEIAMVDGRPTLSAKSMLRMARERGHSITGESTEERAVVHGKRGDNGDEMTVSFSFEQARKIKRGSKPLTDGDAWRNYPEDMLWARAVSRLCRRLFDDVVGSAAYTPDELEPNVPASAVDAATADLPLVAVEEIDPEDSSAATPPSADDDKAAPTGGMAGTSPAVEVPAEAADAEIVPMFEPPANTRGAYAE